MDLVVAVSLAGKLKMRKKKNFSGIRTVTRKMKLLIQSL
jgi:hypothetical protein